MQPLFVLSRTLANAGTTPRTTSTFAVNAGDLVLAKGMSSDGNNLGVPSGGSLNWSIAATRQGDAGHMEVEIYSALVDSAKTMDVTWAYAGAFAWAANVEVWRNHLGVAGTASNVGTGAPSQNITTQYPQSAVSMVVADFSAIDGATRDYRANAGAFTEVQYIFDNLVFGTSYSGYHANTGIAGTYNLGLTVPNTGMIWSLVAVEIRGVPNVEPDAGKLLRPFNMTTSVGR